MDFDENLTPIEVIEEGAFEKHSSQIKCDKDFDGNEMAAKIALVYNATL